MLAGACARWRQRDLAVGFITWRCNYEEAMEQKMLLLQALAAFMNAKLAAGFCTWLNVVRQLNEVKQLARAAVARWRNSAMVWALSMWRYGCILGKEQETMYSWVLRHCRLREMDWALRLWRTTANRQTQVNFALARWQSQNTTAAVNSWRQFALERHQALQLANSSRARVLYFMRNRLVVMAWNTWSTQYAEAKRQQELVLRCLGKIIHRQLSCAIATWRDNTTCCSQLQTTLFWALSHWTLQAAGHALNHWRCAAEELREQQLLMRRGLMRLFNRSMAAAYSTWSDVAAAAREQEELMKRALGKLVHGKLAGAFTRWVERERALKDQQFQMRAVLMRMVYRKVSAALNSWRRQAQNAMDDAANARRALLRFLNRALSEAFTSWCVWYDNTVTQQGALHKSLTRLLNRQLTAGFNSWYAYAVQLAIQRQAASKAIQYMQMQKLAQAWNQWRDMYENSFDDQSTVLRALFCWTHQRLSAAFNSWIDYANQMHAEMQLLQWAAANFLHMQLARAFHKWLDWVREVKDHKALMGRAAYFWESTSRSYLITASQCMLNTWRYGSSEHSVRQALLVKAVLTWHHQHLALALRTWRVEAAIAVGMSQLYRWVSFHAVLREKRWAFRMLRHLTKQQSLGLRAARRWALSQLYAAVNTWRLVVAHELNLLSERESDMGLNHWEIASLTACMSLWYTRSIALTARQAQVYRGACHWSRKRAVVALGQWFEKHRAAVWIRSQTYRGACQWGRKQAVKTTIKWSERQRTVAWMQAQSYRGACKWSQRAAVKAFTKWYELTALQQEQMESLYKAMFRWAHGKLSACFGTWNFKAQQGRQQEMMMIATQHYRYASIFVVLDHWRDVVHQLVQVELHHVQNSYKAASHRRYSALRTAFEEWKEDWVDNNDLDEQLVDQSGPANILAQACHPYGLFAVSITGTMYGKQDRALYYVVQVSFEGRAAYELNKRYRDFDELNSTLKERFSSIMRAGSPDSPIFPPKKPFTKLNPEFYESRATDLHRFMQGLVTHKEVATSGELCEFLEFQNYYY